jgi:hypothetical protein
LSLTGKDIVDRVVKVSRTAAWRACSNPVPPGGRHSAWAVGLMKADHFLYRYFKVGTNPFKSISNLCDDEIIFFMKENFPNHEWFHANPEKRIERRRKIEKWLFDEFILSGGEPKTNHPCYFTLGRSAFLRESGSFDAEIEIPLDLFSSKNISFTYPDSFFFEWLSRNRDHALYDNELNGKIFTMDEVLDLLTQNKIPEGAQIDTSYGYKFDFYIEAQVWDYDILNNYMIG